MNAAFFLTPKSSVTFLYDYYSVRQGLEKLTKHGFTAVPVLDREGHYIGTAREGDFLRFMFDLSRNGNTELIKDMEGVVLRDIISDDRYEPVSVDISEQDLIEMAMLQNFVPITDDRGIFIGIVTRSSVIRKIRATAQK